MGRKKPLCSWLLEHLRESARTAFCSRRHRDPRQFLRSLIADWESLTRGDDLGAAAQIEEVLIREAAQPAGRGVGRE